MRSLGFVCGFAAALIIAAHSAGAQSAAQTATLTGLITDQSGGAVGGADVRVTNTTTDEQMNAVSNASGAYAFPALAPGVYSVAVSAPGFKTVVHKEVRLLAGSTNSLRTVLEAGPVSEVLDVIAGTDLIRTQTPAVTSTITADFIQALPRNDRNALNFLIFLPGVATIGGADVSVYNDCGVRVTGVRTSTISGLPNNTVNITINGISTTNMRSSCDGFFSVVTPSLDAIEQVSLTSATAGADASGQGAVQIRFVTRSGTNAMAGSVYASMQNKVLNSNTFFNRLSGLPRPQATNYTYGGRIGGPIVIPRVFDGRGRAFFFVNHEEVYNPIDLARERTILREAALNGEFTYGLGVPITVNLWTLAAASGQTATYDPIIQGLLKTLRAAALMAGPVQELVTSPNTATLRYFVTQKNVRHAPTVDLAVNLTPNHRLQGSYYWQRFSDSPDAQGDAEPRFPGLPLFGQRSSYRTTASLAVRSTLSSSMVNELRGGWQWSPFDTYGNVTPDMFANQGGFNLGTQLGGWLSVTGATPVGAPWPTVQNTATWTIDDTLSWLRGAHSFTFGVNFTRVSDWQARRWNAPDLSLGFDTMNDPAEVMFGAGPGQFGPANFPGAGFIDLYQARDLYALLTGRVRAIDGSAVLNEAGDAYVYNGSFRRSERMDEFALFAEDQWRWTPNITVTAGLRYQLQLPMMTTNGVFTAMSAESLCGPSGFADAAQGRFCNIFNPGVFNNPGVVPLYELYASGTRGYHIDVNNIAPNVGVSWRPTVTSGWLRAVLGDPDRTTVSGGFTRAFNRERLDRFLAIYDGNPGQFLPASRGPSAPSYPLVKPGESWPLLFRETDRLGPPAFPTVPSFPMNPEPLYLTNASAFDPAIQVPYTDSWSASLQRPVGRNTAIEVRYIGNVNRQPWGSENWNTPNIYETGFLDEFRVAQANLRANVLAGRGGTFAYFGPGSGTGPLPIFLAHFSGLPASAASDPASYTASGGGAGAAQWTNADYLRALNPLSPSPSMAVNSLLYSYGGTWLANALSAGYPSNFWVMNPLTASAVVTRNVGGSRTSLLVVELRRRLASGFAATGSYSWQRTIVKTSLDLHYAPFDLQQAGVPHAFKMLWTYDLPVGRARRFGSHMHAWLDGVLGGWTLAGTGRLQRQDFVLRNVVLVGMTQEEAQRALGQVRFVTDPLSGVVTVWNMPQDIIDNTRKAYRTDPTSPTYYAPGQEPTGRYFAPASTLECPVLLPGDCGVPDLWFHGRWFREFDFRIAKQFALRANARVEVAAEIFNAFRASNFATNATPGAFQPFRITSTQSGARTAQISWRLIW